MHQHIPCEREGSIAAVMQRGGRSKCAIGENIAEEVARPEFAIGPEVNRPQFALLVLERVDD